MDKADDESWKAHAMHQKMRADDAEKQRDGALAVLRNIEWRGHRDYERGATCPQCGQPRSSSMNNQQIFGHLPGCTLAAALKGGAS